MQFKSILVASGGFHYVIGIHTVRRCCDVITVNAELTVVLVQSLQCRDVGSTFDHLIHPLDAPHHLVPEMGIKVRMEQQYEKGRIFRNTFPVR